MITKKYIKLITRSLTLGLLFTLSACSSFKGTELDYEKIPTSSLNKTIEYGVYTPPDWNKQERLPLVLFLHGVLDSHNTLEQYKLHNHFDEQILAGKLARFILVTPNGDKGFWENWYDGSNNYRDWVLKDILPKVKQDYNTLECPINCSIMGISMGGFGAIRMSALNKNSFAAVSAISAPILNQESSKGSKTPLLIRLFFPLERIFGPKLHNGDPTKNLDSIWSNKNDLALQQVRLQLIHGDKDRPQVINSNQRFHGNLLKANRKHDFHIYQGGHKWLDWKPQFDRAINFLLGSHSK